MSEATILLIFFYIPHFSLFISHSLLSSLPLGGVGGGFSIHRLDCYHPVVSSWLHSVLIEHIDAGATHSRGGVVEIQRVAVLLRLQLIGELALGEVVGSEGVSIEVEVLVHRNLYTLSFLLQELYLAVIGAQGIVLGKEV